MNKTLSLALGALFLAAPAFAAPSPAPSASPSPEVASLRAELDARVRDFNRGDFAGYLSDLGARVSYNGLLIDRAELVGNNQDIKAAFPNVRMRYDDVQIQPGGKSQATTVTTATFAGSTADYGETGMPATYEETGEVTSLYRRLGTRWVAHQLEANWDDSLIRIGEPFALLGDETLPSLLDAGQKYRLRLYVGSDERRDVHVYEAYALVPLASVIHKDLATKVMAGMQFHPLAAQGLDVEMPAPAKAGTYCHLLLVNKTLREGGQDVPLGQQIFCRLAHVEE